MFYYNILYTNLKNRPHETLVLEPPPEIRVTAQRHPAEPRTARFRPSRSDRPVLRVLRVVRARDGFSGSCDTTRK